jgi:UPF0755 protein
VKKIYLSVVIITLFTISLISYKTYQEWQPRKLSEPVAFSVESGEPLDKIALRLKEKGLISSTFLFETYGKWKKYDRIIKKGPHLFNEKGLENIYEELTSHVVAERGISVTIPEGFTVEQIGKTLEENGIVNASEFLSVASKGAGINELFLDKIPAKAESKYRLEGFLFPDTYYFEQDANAVVIAERMIKRFFDVIHEIDVDTRYISLYEWVILASIVEREAVLDEERSKIAGVFLNRIRDNWRLQACATVLYAIGKPKERLLYKDLEIQSPYNTYIHYGLPVGPIANPGLASLQAIIHPEKHDYFFYVTKEDGTKGHNFSKTYNEHQSYKYKSIE